MSGSRLILTARVRRPHRRWIVGLLFLAALVALLPLRLVLALGGNGSMVTAQAVGGLWWSGTIAGLQAGPLPLGNVHAGIRPLPLLIGRAELWVDRPEGSPDGPLHAVLAGGGGDFALRGASGRVPIEGLGDLPIRGATFDGLEVAWRDGKCATAAGTVGLEMAGLGAMLPGGLAFSGPARCAGGALVLPLKGPSGLERLVVRIDGKGAWTADLVIGGLPPELTAPLLERGFRNLPGGVGLTARGSL